MTLHTTGPVSCKAAIAVASALGVLLNTVAVKLGVDELGLPTSVGNGERVRGVNRCRDGGLNPSARSTNVRLTPMEWIACIKWG